MHRFTTRALFGTPDHPELCFRRVYRASATDLLSACTDIDRLARWFGRVEGNPRAVGDPFTAHLGEGPDDVAVGEVLGCEADEIQVSWQWQGESPSVVSARVVPIDDDHSELVLTHALTEPDHAGSYGGGWEQLLQSLGRTLGDLPEPHVSDEALERQAAAHWRTMNEHPLSLEVTLAAPVERVWDAWTTVEGLRRWWWSHWDDVTIETDARVGGVFRFAAPSADIVVEGTYLRVDAPNRLAFSWAWTDAEGTSTDESVDVLLAQGSEPDTTELKLRHTGPWADDTPAESYRQGWDFTLGQLATTLAAE